MTEESMMTSNAPQQVKINMNHTYTEEEEDLKQKQNNNDACSYRRKTEKEALMELIAQEMVTSLMGEEADGIQEDDDDVILKEFQAKLAKREATRKKAKKKAIAKRKLKQERLRQQQAMESRYLPETQHHQLLQEGAAVPSSEIIQEYEDRFGGYGELPDDDSFAGLGLEELVQPSHRSVSSSSQDSHKSPFSSTNSTESISKGSTASVEEIRNMVMASIPQTIRDQIPQEAWGEIFQGSTTGSKVSSKRSSGSKPQMPVEKAPILAVERSGYDDISVISDVTGFVNAFPDGRRVDRKLSMPYNDVTCPDLLSSEISLETSCRTERSSWMDQSNEFKVATAPAALQIPGQPKSVSFGTVLLRNYERILTDNPAVQSGPAIGIGWRFKRGGIFDIEEFEQGRAGSRAADELVLPREVREQMLREAGFSQTDIADMVRVILKSKNQRKQTIHNLSAQGVEEAVENAKKRLGRLLSFGKQSDILK